MTVIKDNLPALDNEDLRKLNNKKVMAMVDEIADNMRESKKVAKVTSIYLLIIIGIIVLLIGGAYLTLAISSGSFTAFIAGSFNVENSDKVILCEYNNITMRFKDVEKVYYFKTVFNNVSCDIKFYEELEK
jgi:hypothetical protein